MNLYRIEKREQPVTIYFADGVVSHGVIFLGPNAYAQRGEQTVLELLREKEPFFPFRDQSGRFALLSKKAITHLCYQAPDENIPVAGPSIGVQITFFGGELLEGTITLDRPEEKNRLGDFINGSPGFFPLRQGALLYLANGTLVREIAPC